MIMASWVCSCIAPFTYFDRCMLIGYASSCRTFEIFSTADEWVACHKLKIDHIYHLSVGWFFLIIAPEKHLRQTQLDSFNDLYSYVGIPIAPEKTCGPLRLYAFIFCRHWTRCCVAKPLFASWKRILKCCSKSPYGGKIFNRLFKICLFCCFPWPALLQRLIDLTIGIKSPHHLIRISREEKNDLKVWQSFLSDFNGRSFFLD